MRKDMKISPEQCQDALRATMAEAGLTRAETAKLLRVSLHSIHAWLKPVDNRSAAPCPLWAVELLRLKLELPQHPITKAANRAVA